MRIIRWVCLVQAAIIVGICSLIVLGAFLPQLGWVGVLGATLLPVFTPWFVVLAVAGAIPAVLAMRVGFRVAGVGMLCIAGSSLVGSIVVFAALLQAAAADGATVDVGQTLTFTELSDGPADDTEIYTTHVGQPVQLDVYRPRSWASSARLPVLLYVHGGGWFSGDRASGARDMRWYADRGYLVISPDYTLATRGSATWNVAPQQIACAMAWTALHADTLHADPQRLAVGGDSAGATMAINAAYTANQDLADTTCGAVPHVVAAVVTSPIVDPIRTWNNTSVQGDAARSMLAGYTGGSPLTFPERYRAISCLTYVSSSSPPTLVIGGANDHLVPHAESVDFVRRLQAAGVQSELITVPYGDHTFDLTFGSIGHQLKLHLFDRFLRLRLAAQ